MSTFVHQEGPQWQSIGVTINNEGFEVVAYLYSLLPADESGLRFSRIITFESSSTSWLEASRTLCCRREFSCTIHQNGQQEPSHDHIELARHGDREIFITCCHLELEQPVRSTEDFKSKGASREETDRL